MTATLRSKKLTKTAFKKYVDYVGKKNLSFACGVGRVYAKAKSFGITLLEDKLKAQANYLNEWEAITPDDQYDLSVMMMSFLESI